MSKKVYYSIIIVIVTAIFVMIGVFWAQNETKNENIQVVFVSKSKQTGFEFWESVKQGAQVAAKEFGVELTLLAPEATSDAPLSESDTLGQIKQMKKAIDQKPDVILLAAVDQNDLLPYAKQAVDQGIKLVMVDSGISENIEDCFVGTDNAAAAKSVGLKMAEKMNGVGKVAIISHQMISSTAIERKNGFREGIEGTDIETIGEYDIGDSIINAYETTMRVLEDHPDLNGIFATNQISGEGVVRALRATGRYRDVACYAIDSSIALNEALEDGIVDGYAVQKPFNMGYMGVKAAVQLVKKEPVKRNIDTGFAFVTQENMHEEEIQKLIYPFI
ncbi:MAG: substrate-binding domain-containing protein [Christensenella sp.]|nr:substrate-binding domain-containing protein [Christensenella sp.]